jgi:hypothetical protein
MRSPFIFCPCAFCVSLDSDKYTRRLSTWLCSKLLAIGANLLVYLSESKETQNAQGQKMKGLRMQHAPDRSNQH